MSETSKHVVVIGASGFVGSVTTQALRRRGAKITAVSAPRLRRSSSALEVEEAVAHLQARFIGADAVVNAAGVGAATGNDLEVLLGANAVLPKVVTRASSGKVRVIHVSSAAVQGRAGTLDESLRTAAFSPYSQSKVHGEIAALAEAANNVVIFRPPGVHAASRSVSQSLARIARSRLASVASPGSAGSPQALATNVGDAIAYLALCDERPPTVVMYPSEGVTTTSLLTDLGGKAPRQLPRFLAKVTVAVLTRASGRSALVAGNVRRLEMMWFGQGQAPSWLTNHGWAPPVGPEGWRELGMQLTAPATNNDRGEK